ncbi:peptide ABC transporter ATP-binding protein [Bacillus canaveralius]|uniref:Peptide ABC transporter ATP-binding protein n=1 Tax=Bacillus canaveralius TaxID=1403243 RepID=A0A2N5GN59_9BACI|nr:MULTISPECIES: ABC transporter ATP-binding protein [Bacillus]PLR83626.1 peptide ABC transporter ATP-binding protein [Bacillus canaveralius]PLR86905.1 peptide ABC transporter ATP-binding protein [Bacillus sp. V33-4]PLR90829.1 peptide ABC transporter ATP-binding protein [Bacillus canaveralius]RSK45083.1 ABC transporter ATP-binding protein [Bacillus canaveralius]
MAEAPVLDVKHLKTSFFSSDGEVPAVDEISFAVQKGEIIGIVGESGCGKSVTSLSIMKLIPQPPGKIVGGQIFLNGEDIVNASEKRMRQIRGNEVAMIFQEPMTSLNPLFTIGQQLTEAILIHNKIGKKAAFQQSVEMLKLVGLARAEQIMKEYPHQLSGGMRQRVMIAMALSCHPKLLIADEPTTALDVTIQAQILALMKDLNVKLDTAIVMITHDLGIVAELCQRVIVMYAGKIVEESSVQAIFKEPKHPYTLGLLKSIPDIRDKKERLYSIPGNVPKPGSITQGCRFAARCEYVFDRCLSENPPLYNAGDTNVRCFLHESGGVANV